MSRVIKFRAWDKSIKSFIYETDMRFGSPVISLNGKAIYLYGGHGGGSDWEENNNLIITQFTGIHDKNGNEIFDGDLVFFECDFLKFELCKVIFKKGCFGVEKIKQNNLNATFYPFDEYLTCDDIEYKGNIFENPELLEVNDG